MPIVSATMRTLLGVASVLILACGQPNAATTPSSTAIAEATTPVSSSPSPAPEASATAPAAAPTNGDLGCTGGVTCKSFDDAAAALGAVLEGRPRIVAFGESHAQKGAANVASPTRRFTDELLPSFKGQAQNLVLELWVADGKCGKATEKKVAEKQREVTKPQADTNQNEFVTLGEKSRAAGIVPWILKPSCEEYETVQKAGNDAVLKMLDLVTANMKKKATELFKKEETSPGQKTLVLYGGMMHNDRVPPPEWKSWSYAEDLSTLASGKYVEVDLVVPEYVKEGGSWSKMPWYAAYGELVSSGKLPPDKAILLSWSEGAYALVFPRSDKP